MKEVERLDIVVKYSVTVAEGQLEEVMVTLEAGQAGGWPGERGGCDGLEAGVRVQTCCWGVNLWG